MGKKDISMRNHLLIVMSFFTIIVVLIVASGNYFINKIHDIYKINDIVQELNKDFVEVITAEEAFLKSEISHISFYESGRSENVEDLKEKVFHTIQELNNLKDLNSYDKFKIHEDLFSLTGEFNNYENTFDLIVEKIKEKGFKNYGLEGEMNKYISELEKKSKPIGIQHLLMLRKHEKDFFLHKEPEYVGKFNKKINDIKTVIWSGNTLKGSQKDSLDALLNNYQNTFEKLVVLTNEIGYQDNQGLCESLLLSKNSIEKHFSSIQHKTFTNVEGLVQNLHMGFLFVVVNILAIAGFIALLYTKREKGPVKISAPVVSSLPTPAPKKRAPKIIVTSRRLRAIDPVRKN